MKNIVLATILVVQGQNAFADYAPEPEVIVSPALANAKLVKSINFFPTTDCTQSSAEAHALAYPATATPETNVTNRGRHEVVITNCTGETAIFTTEILLQSEAGGLFQAIDLHELADQTTSLISYDSSYVLNYPNPGNYILTAETIVTGPISDSAIGTAVVSIVIDD